MVIDAPHAIPMISSSPTRMRQGGTEMISKPILDAIERKKNQTESKQNLRT
jgi:hypothetical protein